MELNFFLQVANGAIAMLTFFLLFFLFVYLHYDIRRDGFKFKTFFLMSTAASLVVTIAIEKLGTFFTRLAVWIWRGHGGVDAFSTTENALFVLGAMLTAFGLVLMIRVLSRPRFGDWPWMFSVTMAAIYVVVECSIWLTR